MSVAVDTSLTSADWMQYALIRIRALVDKPLAAMTETELAIYRFATSALSGGEPVVPVADTRVCRMCGEEWGRRDRAVHAPGCPMTH